jgi:hypothetical protein
MLGRRTIFAILAVVMIGAMLLRFEPRVTVSSSTQRVFDAIDALDSTDVVMISFDHEASSLPEVGPLGIAIADHCFQRGIGVIGLALFAEGTAAGYDLLGNRAEHAGREYGTDWIYLGFRPQYTAAILGMGESVEGVFATDYGGRAYSSLPLAQRVTNYDDIALVISVADGSMPTYWVEFAQSRYDQKIIAALSAVMVTSFLPYLDAGQLEGILAGFTGAAEYEKLLGAPGAGMRGMTALSTAHGALALLVLWGNVEAWRDRRRKKAGRS